MKKVIRKILILLLLSILFKGIILAQYRECIQESELELNLHSDYGMVDDAAASDQSALLQSAINDISARGGGRLILPRGTYSFAGIYMNSNVHLVLDKDVLIKPYIHDNQKTNNVFFFTNKPVDPANSKGEEGFIENVSIRCKDDGEYFIIDYSHIPRSYKGIRSPSARAFKFVQVRNFRVSGVFVIDNWTRHCAATFVPAKAEGCNTWEVFKPSGGLIKDFKSINSSPGYGLAQLHAGYALHFENLSTTNGGITFRLETGAGGYYGGVDKITANNIRCENGATAMAMGPHTAKNGMVKASNILAISCGTAVQMGPGFVDGRENDGTPGRFADGCLIENVHAVFGNNAPLAYKGVGEYPEEFLALLWFDDKIMMPRGPSRYVVQNKTGDSWEPEIRNVSSEGFKSEYRGVTHKEKKKRKDYRPILKEYPIWDHIPRSMKKSTQMK